MKELLLITDKFQNVYLRTVTLVWWNGSECLKCGNELVAEDPYVYVYM